MTRWQRTAHRLRQLFEGTVATAIVTALGFFDDWVFGPIVASLAALLPPILTFAITTVAYGFLQYGASLWLVSRWNEWIEGENGRRLQARLQKWRQGRITRHAVGWVTSGSIWWFGLASIIFATVDVVAIFQLSSDESLPRRRIAISAAVYGTWCAALWTAAGYGLGKGIRSA
jgi:hypothetical protein